MMRILATDLSDAPDRRMTSRLDRPRRSSAATRSPSGVEPLAMCLLRAVCDH
jgi:hypothetical protein